MPALPPIGAIWLGFTLISQDSLIFHHFPQFHQIQFPPLPPPPEICPTCNNVAKMHINKFVTGYPRKNTGYPRASSYCPLYCWMKKTKCLRVGEDSVLLSFGFSYPLPFGFDIFSKESSFFVRLFSKDIRIFRFQSAIRSESPRDVVGIRVLLGILFLVCLSLSLSCILFFVQISIICFTFRESHVKKSELIFTVLGTRSLKCPVQNISRSGFNFLSVLSQPH